MAEIVETDRLAAVLGSGVAGTKLAAVRAATVGNEAASALDAVDDFVVVQRLGSIVRAQLKGGAFSLSIEREDGTLASFGAPRSGYWTTVVELDAASVSVVDAESGVRLWPREAELVTAGATLHFSNGSRIPVERTTLIGRSPRVERVALSELPALVPIDTHNPAVSRTHLRISVDGTRSLLEDLGSTNGTAIAPVGGVPRVLEPGEVAELEDGMVVTIAERVAFRVELS